MRRAMMIGYARTSTTDQTAGLAAQERDLQAAGAEKLFSEQVSSVAHRDALDQCLGFLREGDVLVVSKPDRLARSTAELLTIEADLTRRGIGLVVLSMGGERLDTRNPTSKLMLTILAGVATWEREIMLERQREGIARAKADGKYKGRPANLDAAEVARLSATMGPAAIAKQLGMARSSVYRLLGGGSPSRGRFRARDCLGPAPTTPSSATRPPKPSGAPRTPREARETGTEGDSRTGTPGRPPDPQ